jgi:hypothetical protein
VLIRTLFVLADAAALVLPASGNAVTRTLYATVGPGSTIVMKNAAGARVKSVPAGTYTIVVRDLSAAHNFRLRGSGVNRATSVFAKTTVKWKNVKLLRGKLYTFVCDPHARFMRGTLKVV